MNILNILKYYMHNYDQPLAIHICEAFAGHDTGIRVRTHGGFETFNGTRYSVQYLMCTYAEHQGYVHDGETIRNSFCVKDKYKARMQ